MKKGPSSSEEKDTTEQKMKPGRKEEERTKGKYEESQDSEIIHRYSSRYQSSELSL